MQADELPGTEQSFALNYRMYEGSRQDECCPILVIPAMLASIEHWHEFCKSYSELTGRKVIAVDCRNHGQSRRHSHMSYPIMAGDIAKTFQQLNISRAIVIGHSVGSKVAMEFALSMPDSVEKLILEDLPPMVVPAPLIPGVLSAMLNLDLSQISSINDADDKLREPIPYDAIRAYVLTDLRKEDKGQFQWVMDVKNVLDNLENLIGQKSAIELNNRAPYTGETLFIAGGESNDLKNADVDEIRKLFPKANMEVILGASHFVHTDKPREFLDVVHKFLE